MRPNASPAGASGPLRSAVRGSKRLCDSVGRRVGASGKPMKFMRSWPNATGSSEACRRRTPLGRHPPDDPPVGTDICANRQHWQDGTSANCIGDWPNPRCLRVAGRECRFHLHQGIALPWLSLGTLAAALFTRRSKSSLRVPSFDSPAGFSMTAS